jgi:hypothetical protein
MKKFLFLIVAAAILAACGTPATAVTPTKVAPESTVRPTDAPTVAPATETQAPTVPPTATEVATEQPMVVNFLRVQPSEDPTQKRLIAALLGNDQRTKLVIFDSENMQPLFTDESGVSAGFLSWSPNGRWLAYFNDGICVLDSELMLYPQCFKDTIMHPHYPTWTADDKLIAQRDSQIFTLDLLTGVEGEMDEQLPNFPVTTTNVQRGAGGWWYMDSAGVLYFIKDSGEEDLIVEGATNYVVSPDGTRALIRTDETLVAVDLDGQFTWYHQEPGLTAATWMSNDFVLTMSGQTPGLLRAWDE